MTAAPMSPAAAEEYAPQWGCYISAGDPGAFMYGDLTDAATAAGAIAYIDSDCVPIARSGDCCGTEGECAADLADLAALRAYLAALRAYLAAVVESGR